MRNAMRHIIGPTMYMARPAIRLSLYSVVRSSVGISMEARSVAPPVNTKL